METFYLHLFSLVFIIHLPVYILYLLLFCYLECESIAGQQDWQQIKTVNTKKYQFWVSIYNLVFIGFFYNFNNFPAYTFILCSTI